MLTINKNTLLFFPILVSLCFPYVTPYSFGTDIQPWSILIVFTFTLLILFLDKKEKFNKQIIFLWIPFIISVPLIFVSPDIFSAFRSLLGLLTIALVPLVTFYILKRDRLLFIKILKISSVIYLIVGLIQVSVNKNFLMFLLNTIRTSQDRGVTSLTVEPTFYGLLCLFLILIFLVMNVENKRRYIYILLFQIVFLSQSAMTILLTLLFSLYYIIFKTNIRVILYFSFFCIFMYLILTNTELLAQDLRVVTLLNLFISSPTQLISSDPSTNFRFADIYFSFKGFIDNFLLPNGFGNYQEYLNYEISQQSIFRSGNLWVTGSNRINSYYGSLLFELGLIGLIVPITYSLLIFKAFRRNKGDFFLHIFFINTLLLTAIPLSFTFVGVYFAALVYLNYEEGQKNLAISNEFIK